MDYFSKSGALSLAAGVACGLLLAWKLHGYYSNSSTNLQVEKAVEENEKKGKVMRENGKFRLALVVCSKCKMHKRKVAAHCSHAALCAYKYLQKRDPEMLKEWEICGQPTIVYKAPYQTTLVGLCTHAEKLGIATSLIQDAGSSQTADVSASVLAIGPGPASLINAVTEYLKLY